MVFARSVLFLLLVTQAIVGCSGYKDPAARGETTEGVVAKGQDDHAMRVKEQREIISAQEKILTRQQREYMDAKRQKEQNKRLERYGSETKVDTFNGY